MGKTGSVNVHLRIFAAGLMAILPLAIAVAVVLWVGGLLHSLVGPGSLVGDALSSVGLAIVTGRTASYLAGCALSLAAIYLLGLALQSRLKGRIEALTDRTVKRIPLLGSVYGLTSRFTGIFDRKEQTDLKAMSPVWCFFGGEGGTAVLALMPSPDPVVLEGHRYLAILVPSAPVPFGGGLLYVPADWVKPAGFGVEKLTSVYVSMGVSPPEGDQGNQQPKEEG